jgi:hypothetical protein
MNSSAAPVHDNSQQQVEHLGARALAALASSFTTLASVGRALIADPHAAEPPSAPAPAVFLLARWPIAEQGSDRPAPACPRGWPARLDSRATAPRHARRLPCGRTPARSDHCKHRRPLTRHLRPR